MEHLLGRIDNPAELKNCTLEELSVLAGELRHSIIHTVSQTGGHLAPSLGTVELTLALHRAFDCPEDKIIWDVGHQAYAHKILTGRRDAFIKLRQKGGITGFPKREESIYDAFGTGHSSTSISAALGMAAARDMAGAHYRVAAVIGDGALTGGEAFEGLNNAGELGRDIIVILNDNGMSIAPNVGAVSEYLARFRMTPGYRRAKRDIKNFLKRTYSILKGTEVFIVQQNMSKMACVLRLCQADFLPIWGFIISAPWMGTISLCCLMYLNKLNN